MALYARRVSLLLLAGCQGPATLTRVQEEVFTPSCAFSSCHGGNAGELSLEAGDSYGNLVGVPVAGIDDEVNPDVDVSGEIRVIPGDPENSYLIKKLTIGATGIKGSPMPDGFQGMEPERVEIVASWIANGALDD
jgi:hypothetical protein